MPQAVPATALLLRLCGLLVLLRAAAGAHLLEVSGTGAVLTASTASSSENTSGARAAALSADGSVLAESVSESKEAQVRANKEGQPGQVIRVIPREVVGSAATSNDTSIVPLVTCTRILAKAQKLLEINERQMRETGRGRKLRRFQREALRDLQDGRVNDQVVLKVQAALGRVRLRVALQTGDVWTAQDQYSLNAECMSRAMRPTRPLEEQEMTDSGEPIFQGDMATGSSEVSPLAASQSRWANGLVSYCYSNDTGTAARIAVEEAMRHIARQVPCVRFQHVGALNSTSCRELPSVLIVSRTAGCWSHVGQVSGNVPAYQGRSQLLNLGRGCEHMGMAAHQLAHALGMTHMATRIDRDLFLRIIEDNIAPARVNASFRRNSNPPPITAYSAHPYDLLSITMYPAQAFSMNATVLSVEPKQEPLLSRFLGQRMGFSQLDVDDLGDMYRCMSQVRPSDISKGISQLFQNGSGFVFDGSCKDRSYTGIEFLDSRNATRLFQCSDLATKCYDPVLGSRARFVCPQRCLGCIAAPQDAIAFEAARRARSIVLLNTTNTLPPVTECVDAEETGIRFRNGAKASCEDLTNYCDHPSLGTRVKIACVKTCGRCGLQNNDFIDATGHAANSCVDQPAMAKPLMMVSGQPALCREVKEFCVGHPNSEFVVKKCPVTCGFCDPTRSTTLELPPTTTTVTTTTTWTGTYTFSKAIKESEEGVGCSRRRRWGFCYNRRRRLT